MNELIELAKYAAAGITPLGLFLLYLALYPEKVEKWAAMLWRLLQGIRYLWVYANKKYIKHDLQGRVNDFTKRLAQEVPSLKGTGIRLEWVSGRTTREAFLQNGEVVVCLRKENSNTENFVRASMLYISNALLSRAKRYISPSQGEAADLYVGYQLFRSQKPEVVDAFVDGWLHPQIGHAGNRSATYFQQYDKIAESGLFFPLYLHQITLLGNKVFGKRRDNLIIQEVDRLIDFLEIYSQRKVGEEGQLEFEGQHCKFGIVIIGKSCKVAHGKQQYVNFIQSILVPLGLEYIYILGPLENVHLIDETCAELRSQFDVEGRRNVDTTLHFSDQPDKQTKNRVVVLRRKDILPYDRKGPKKDKSKLRIPAGVVLLEEK